MAALHRGHAPPFVPRRAERPAIRCRPRLGVLGMIAAARLVALIVVGLVPLAVWPPAPEPFVAPRLWLIASAIAVVGGLLALGRQPRPALPRAIWWAALAWLASVALSAAVAPVVVLAPLAIALVPMAWGWTIAWARPPCRHLAAAVAAGAAAVAVVAMLQWFGADPFAWLGWAPVGQHGDRMRVYATLGNPNFVGAFLAATLPVWLLLSQDGLRGARTLAVAGAAIQVVALAATGSRGAWLGASAGIGLLAVVRARTWTTAGAIVVPLVVAGVLLVATADRPLARTLRGRAHIWSVTAPHLLDRPLAGFGPGSFALLYPQWEVARWDAGVDDDVRRFAAAQRHAHNDYIQRLAEQGVPGLIAWLALTGALTGSTWLALTGELTGSAWRRPRDAGNDFRLAAASGIVALAATALVDFPLQRPVECATWWTLAAMVAMHTPAPKEA